MTCPLASVFKHVVVVASRQNLYSPELANDSKLPLLSRSICLMTVISGRRTMALAGTGTFCAPVCSKAPGVPLGASLLCCEEPVQSPTASATVSV